MTRYELENWCEKFLKDIFENGKPVTEFMAKAIEEDMDEKEIAEGIRKLSSNAKTYTDYKGKLADFIEQFSKEIGTSKGKP